MNYYKQCKISKGNTHHIAFIPEVFAIVGKRIKLKEEGSWVEGFTINEVSCIMVDEGHLPDSHKEIKSHRNQTGDSQSKDKSKRTS